MDTPPMSTDPAKVVIVRHDPPPPRDDRHVHRWAWALLARGGEVLVCYGCGKERR